MALPELASFFLIAAAAALQPAPAERVEPATPTAAVERAAEEAAEAVEEAAQETADVAAEAAGEAAEEAGEAAEEAAEAAAESQPDEPEVCRRTQYVDDFGRNRSRRICRPRSEWGPSRRR